MITVAQAMVKCLQKENISVVFGYPGAAICPFYDALAESDIKNILVRQEQHAGHAASGYARISEKPAVCIATSGPGALNLITAIATAYMDSVPLVVITGQVHSELLGRDVFQEADITGAVEPFIKYSYIVKDGKDIGRIFKEAFFLAGTGRPGPVLIDMPVNVQQQKINFEYPEEVSMRSYKPTVKGHPGQIKRAVNAIANAKKPLICAGGGVFLSKAEAEVCDFAEQANIPVVTTMMGLGVLPSEHPLNFGMIGMHGVKPANEALHRADLILMVGARCGDRSVSNTELVGKDTKIIHIDIDPAEIGKNLSVDIPIVGDAKVVLADMIERVKENPHSQEWIDNLHSIPKTTYTFSDEETEFINPKTFLARVSEKADKNVTVVADVGQNQIWTANNFKLQEGRFLTSGGMGTMGYAIAAGVGAKFADPDHQVITVCGDGSFQMQMMELGTIAQNNVPVKMIVMSNRFLGMVREIQDRMYHGVRSGVDLGDKLDVSKVATAYSIESARISSMSEVDEAIEKMLAYDGPYLLECMVHPDESTL